MTDALATTINGLCKTESSRFTYEDTLKDQEIGGSGRSAIRVMIDPPAIARTYWRPLLSRG